MNCQLASRIFRELSLASEVIETKPLLGFTEKAL
jgi:hypothetical protein